MISKASTSVYVSDNILIVHSLRDERGLWVSQYQDKIYSYEMSNTEFFILLRMKPQDIEKLSDVTEIPEAMQRYIQRPKQKGSGLIIAGDTIVPFQNPIPKNTKLYKLAQTDA